MKTQIVEQNVSPVASIASLTSLASLAAIDRFVGDYLKRQLSARAMRLALVK